VPQLQAVAAANNATAAEADEQLSRRLAFTKTLAELALFGKTKPRDLVGASTDKRTIPQSVRTHA